MVYLTMVTNLFRKELSLQDDRPLPVRYFFDHCIDYYRAKINFLPRSNYCVIKSSQESGRHFPQLVEIVGKLKSRLTFDQGIATS